jgi:tRNA(Ile)-lysidine synthase
VRQLDLPARFAAALEAVPADLRAGPIGLAVSGGSDSVALLTLAHQWAAKSGASLIVLTVDHHLRPAAAAEAASVASLCERFGLSHQTLRWQAPEARQSAARRARHALLAGALKSAGGQLLLTGHSADDQAETFLMRARQGSGWYGLACMRALSLSPVWPEGAGVWIARPLLGERRAHLRGWLTGQGTGWSDDPSNGNPAFERVRVRARLSGPDDTLTGRLLSCQRRFVVLRAIEDAALADWLGHSVTLSSEGAAFARLDTLPPERAARALGTLIQCLAGRETPPRAESLAGLIARIHGDPAFRGATLGGVRVSPHRLGLKLSPERARNLNAPDCAALGSRIGAFRRLFLNSAQEIAAGSGKESFLQDVPPIFCPDTVSFVRDLP